MLVIETVTTDRAERSRRFPRLGWAGVVVMVVGLVADITEHTLIPHAGELAVAGYPVSEHAAHLVVIVGMVLLLAGVVVDGVRASHRRGSRRERSGLDAVR